MALGNGYTLSSAGRWWSTFPNFPNKHLGGAGDGRCRASATEIPCSDPVVVSRILSHHPGRVPCGPAACRALSGSRTLRRLRRVLPSRRFSLPESIAGKIRQKHLEQKRRYAGHCVEIRCFGAVSASHPVPRPVPRGDDAGAASGKHLLRVDVQPRLRMYHGSALVRLHRLERQETGGSSRCEAPTVATRSKSVGVRSRYPRRGGFEHASS